MRSDSPPMARPHCHFRSEGAPSPKLGSTVGGAHTSSSLCKASGLACGREGHSRICERCEWMTALFSVLADPSLLRNSCCCRAECFRWPLAMVRLTCAHACLDASLWSIFEFLCANDSEFCLRRVVIASASFALSWRVRCSKAATLFLCRCCLPRRCRRSARFASRMFFGKSLLLFCLCFLRTKQAFAAEMMALCRLSATACICASPALFAGRLSAKVRRLCFKVYP